MDRLSDKSGNVQSTFDRARVNPNDSRNEWESRLTPDQRKSLQTVRQVDEIVNREVISKFKYPD